MKNLQSIISEKLILNKTVKIFDNNKQQYFYNWHWFNVLVTNVDLSEKNYRDMFANLTDDELKVWIKEVKDCYSGSPQEDEANKIGDDVDLARFYAKYPITE